MSIDPSTADFAIFKVVGAIFTILLGSFGVWRRLSKTRADNSEDSSRTTHMKTLEQDARQAKAEAHEATTKVQGLSQELGELKGLVKLWQRLYDEAQLRIGKLEEQNERQAVQIAGLMQKKTLDPNASDYRG